MGKVRVRAHGAVLGLQAGQTGEAEDSDALRAAIASGRLEKITVAEAKRAAEEGAPEGTITAGA